MRILHYFLGFNRAGGLNRYAADLAATQKEAGEQVFALCPGGTLLPRKTAVIQRVGARNGIPTYELRGGNPIPLLEGLRDPDMILRQKHRLSPEALAAFCQEVRPDVLHIHTWMGFPEELIPCLKKQNCRILFSSHDYYAICPKVNFIQPDGTLCLSPGNESCSRCNAAAPSERFLQLRNISFLFKIKNLLMPMVRLLRHSPRNSTSAQPVQVLNYQKLREHYYDLLKECDAIHFNSNVTRNVYLRYYPDLDGPVLPITHRGIVDRRENKELSRNRIRLCFIGALTPYKGFPILKSALMKLKKENVVNWSLDAWCNRPSGPDPEVSEITYHGSFTLQEEGKVLRNADLLIVPSICFETFGFIVAEALSFGVPVLCSDTVGAQSMVSPEMVYHGASGLQETLGALLRDGDRISACRAGILSGEQEILTCLEHWNILKEKLYCPTPRSGKNPQNAGHCRI